MARERTPSHKPVSWADLRAQLEEIGSGAIALISNTRQLGRLLEEGKIPPENIPVVGKLLREEAEKFSALMFPDCLED